jgi:hypothetical protein
LSHVTLVEFPWEQSPIAANLDQWMKQVGVQRWTHLISVERPSPSHTLESLERQPGASPSSPRQFAALVPEASRDHCHNMRGEAIDEHVAPIHRLFDRVVERHLPITTIGIGDGGNEIGMGSFAWESLVEAIDSPQAAKIISRVACDYTLVGGTSDWAAYALALAVAALRGPSCADWDASTQAELVEHLVSAGAVDGATRNATATVDGLPLDVYLEPLVAMRKLLGFAGR